LWDAKINTSVKTTIMALVSWWVQHGILPWTLHNGRGIDLLKLVFWIADPVLEYLSLIAYSWCLHYNSLDWDSILLNHWRTLQNWLLHSHTNFQLILLNRLSGRSGILLVILDHAIITHCWFFRCIFIVFSSISFKPQKVWGLIVKLSLYQFSATY